MQSTIAYPIYRAAIKSVLFILLLFFQSALLANEDAQIAEVEKFWAQISDSVSKGDFEAYRSAHHDDAVLLMEGRSHNMENTHKFFKRGFDDTAAGAVEAGIEFLWTQRSVGSDTAFQKGVFRYWSKAGGIDYMQYTPFEVVLVKGKTGWKLLTQKQAKAITKEQWDALVDKKKNKKES